MLNLRGMTLIEIIMVIALLGILFRIAMFGFHEIQMNANQEKQAKELYDDVTSQRLRAIHSKKTQRMSIAASTYTFRSYSSEGDAAGTATVSKNLKYYTMQSGRSSITFDFRGFTNLTTTIRLLPAGGGGYDCIFVGNAKDSVGKMTNGTCLAK